MMRRHFDGGDHHDCDRSHMADRQAEMRKVEQEVPDWMQRNGKED
jgi:hypothetical protein